MTIGKTIYSKIINIKNMQKITKAMEMISASKMRKTQERMIDSRYYLEKICQVINNLTYGNLEYKHPYLCHRNVTRICYVIISTNRGLTGGLNTSLFKKILENIEMWNKKNVKITFLIIGSKGISFFSRIKSEIIAQVMLENDKLSSSDLIGPIKIILQEFDKKRIDKIFLARNKFVNTMLQLPQILQILPINRIMTLNTKIQLKEKSWDYLYEPDAITLLNTLLHRYIETQIYQGIIENLASEQAARMVAMKCATDNGNNLIQELQLLYNKTRQSCITQELLEIISGASAI